MNLRLTAFVVITLGILAAGFSTGARIYYIAALALMMLLIMSLISVIWALATVKIDMRGVKGHVSRGESFMAVFSVSHKSILPVGSIRLRITVPAQFRQEQEISVTLPPFTKRGFRYKVFCAHRGVYEAGVTDVIAADLFGLVTLSKKTNKRAAIIEVMPRVNTMSPFELKVSDMGKEMSSRATEDAASPSDVRKWMDGDALKKVHWKLSMRKQEIMVRTFEESSRPDTLLIPDLTRIDAMSDQALTIEDCVCEACASIAKAQLEAGYPVRMPLTSRHPGEVAGQSAGDYAAFMDALMRVDFDSPYEYERVLMIMMTRLQRTGGAILVTPRLSTRIADIAAQMARSGVRARVVWITDTRLSQSIEISEKLRADGVSVERVNPWNETASAAENDPEDDLL